MFLAILLITLNRSFYCYFFFNDTATTEIYTLSLHDALPICLNVDGMNIISNDGSNKLNMSRKARVSYKVQRTINASLNEIGRAVQQECRDRSRMPSSA